MSDQLEPPAGASFSELAEFHAGLIGDESRGGATRANTALTYSLLALVEEMRRG